ncbi:MAG: hypothetical protein Q7S92_05790 [Candidatus Diapherotrites archaeon]|nr:hypothetical protein [Candidatus Diapherotrites archaeon]
MPAARLHTQKIRRIRPAKEKIFLGLSPKEQAARRAKRLGVRQGKEWEVNREHRLAVVTRRNRMKK